MLESIGLLSADELGKLTEALDRIALTIKDGSFKLEDDVEDIHSQVELLLTRELGDIGKKIHSGRSRNDQVLLDIKLFLRSELLTVRDEAWELFKTLQSLSEKYKDIEVYVYFPTRIEETSLMDNQDVFSVYPELKDEFMATLGEKVKTESLKIETVEDFYKYFYKTDPHWTGYGSYQGYTDIINMMRLDLNVGDPKDCTFVIYPHNFYGSNATKLAFECDPDHLVDCQFEITGYDYSINNNKDDDNKGINIYKEEGNIEGLYSDYEFAYGANDFIREYDFHQEDKPNLLIFSDSYVNPIKKAIASHFNKTVIVDLRANDGTFSLDQVIKDNNIDAILFLQAYEDLYFNGYLFVPLN